LYHFVLICKKWVGNRVGKYNLVYSQKSLKDFQLEAEMPNCNKAGKGWKRLEKVGK